MPQCADDDDDDDDDMEYEAAGVQGEHEDELL
jgi:hypothetical protein